MPTQPRSQCSFPNAERLVGEEPNQLLCVRKEALGTSLMPTKTVVRAMCKCIQKPLALLMWDWLI